MKYLGAPLKTLHMPSNILFYLAFYVYLDTSFFIMTERQPTLLL